LHLFYIPYSEERGLEKRFGEAYRTYKQHVPRWIPRLTPWDPGIKFNGE
jgi:protein-S-isoprenylcysteine O-methyltransferase Ste14